MSDDTPTRRFPEHDPDGTSGASGADQPTQRLDAAGGPEGGVDPQPTVPNEPAPPTAPTVAAPAAAATPGPGPAAPTGEPTSGKRGKGLLITLIALGGALLIAIIVLLIMLLTRDGAPVVVPTMSETPSVSPTPTETSESPSPEPEPEETEAPPPPPPPAPDAISSYTASTTTVDCTGGGPVPVTFSWAATGDTLWFGVGTDNAQAAPVGEFPLNYTMDFDYQCGQPNGSQRYTITVQATDGTLSHETIVIEE